MGFLPLLFYEVIKMYFKINCGDGEFKYFDDPDDVIDYCIEDDYHEDDDYFEEWVNDREDSVTINGETYYPYQILENIDYGNLRDLREQYCEYMNEDDADDARSNMRHASIGDRFWIQNYEVYVIEDWEVPESERCEEPGDYPDEYVDELRERIEKEISEDDMMEMFQITGG